MARDESDRGSAAQVVDVSPDVLEQWLEQGDAVLVDVREDFEHATERIAGAHHFALSKFDPEAIRSAHGAHRVVFHCRTGVRSADAAARFGSSNQGTRSAGASAGGPVHS